MLHSIWRHGSLLNPLPQGALQGLCSAKGPAFALQDHSVQMPSQTAAEAAFCMADPTPGSFCQQQDPEVDLELLQDPASDFSQLLYMNTLSAALCCLNHDEQLCIKLICEASIASGRYFLYKQCL